MKTSLSFLVGLFAVLSLTVIAEAKPLSEEDVDRVVSKHSNRVTNCYVKHATAHTGGKVILEMHIRANGRVKWAQVQVQNGTAKLHQCITRGAKRWRFPRADTKTLLRYPFVFKYATR